MAAVLASTTEHAAVAPDRPPQFRLDLPVRKRLYRDLNLSPDQQTLLEACIESSGRRNVGRGALKNVIAQLPERKCFGPKRLVESSSVELHYALSLELDSDVVGYFPQVPLADVIWNLPERRIQRSESTLDFLVFRKRGIAFVEGKSEEDLERLVSDPASGWSRSGHTWKHAPFEQRAKELGVEFEVFAQPMLFGFSLQTLESMAAVVDETPSRGEHRLAQHALSQLRTETLSIAQLMQRIPGFSPRLALWMLANERCFGLLRSRSFTDVDRYLLFGDRECAKRADEALQQGIAKYFEQPEIGYGYLTGRESDRRVADRRSDRLKAIASGKAKPNSYYDNMAVRTESKVQAGQGELDALVGNYRNSGNRRPRLSKITGQIVSDAITDGWNKGKFKTLADLHLHIEKKCKKRRQKPPSYRTIRVRTLRQGSPNSRALRTGGLRAYAAIRERSDATCITLPAIGYLHTLVIDSSDFDLKTKPTAILKCLPEKPRFYVGVDGCSGKAVAHALLFGAARTDGLAILLREFVKRNGCLPRVIQVDRGPENTSDWMKEFCRVNRIILRYPPTAGSVWNGVAENVIGQANSRVAHRMRGNTKNDAMGRKVDGRFKSKHHVAHSFETAEKELTSFLYSTYCDSPGQDDLSPNQRADNAIQTLGRMGRRKTFDLAFAIQTSIPVQIKKRVRDRQGVWWNYAVHTSREYLRAIKRDALRELRSDCVDPAIVYALVGLKWYALFNRTAQQFAESSTSSKLSRLLQTPAAKADTRAAKTRIGRNLASRIRNAERAAAATKHLHPSRASSPVQKKPTSRSLPLFPWSKSKAL